MRCLPLRQRLEVLGTPSREQAGLPLDEPDVTLEQLGEYRVRVESGGKTTFTSTTLFDSVEMRDKMLKSGMESGASASYDRLEAFLASI